MRYVPGTVPTDPQRLSEFLRRELQRIADSQDTVLYRTLPVLASLSAGVSADWKVAAGNVIRISASATMTLTGLNVLNPANREMVLVNVGTTAVVLLSNDAASSASYRFALPATWNLSANGAAVIWYDSVSARWRGIART